jgi:hypothetical protein
MGTVVRPKGRLYFQIGRESTRMKPGTKRTLGVATAAVCITAAVAFNAAGINSSLDYGAFNECGASGPCQQAYWRDAYDEWDPYYRQYLSEYWWYYGMGYCNYWEYQDICAGYADDVNQLSMVVSHINFRMDEWN